MLISDTTSEKTQPLGSRNRKKSDKSKHLTGMRQEIILESPVPQDCENETSFERNIASEEERASNEVDFDPDSEPTHQIMIVDDDPLNLHLLSQVIKSLGNFKVIRTLSAD